MGRRGAAHIAGIESLVAEIVKVVATQGIAQVPAPFAVCGASQAQGYGLVLDMRLYMRVIVCLPVVGMPHDGRDEDQVVAVVDGKAFRLGAVVAGVGIGIRSFVIDSS